LVLEEFDVLTSEVAWGELEETAAYDDPDGRAAQQVLKVRSRLEVRPVPEEAYVPLLGRRLDEGEASCLILAREPEVEALISDDFDALPYLERHARAQGIELGLGVALIQALIRRGKLSPEEGGEIFERIARRRGWLGRPIYEYAKRFLGS